MYNGCIEINPVQEKYTYQELVWPWAWGYIGWYGIIILSCLDSTVYFNCIVQDSLYHNMDIGTVWHCALVSCIPSQPVMLVFGCVLIWCWVSVCVRFTNSYFIMMVATIIGILCPFYSFWTTYLSFPKLGSSGSPSTHDKCAATVSEDYYSPINTNFIRIPIILISPDKQKDVRYFEHRRLVSFEKHRVSYVLAILRLWFLFSFLHVYTPEWSFKVSFSL